MTSFLFIVSFLLHIISIVAIYALSKQLSMNKSKDSSEFISLMENYLEEIKEENRRLQKELANIQPTAKNEDAPINVEDEPSLKVEEHEEIPTSLPGSDIVKDEVEVSQHSRILQLYKEGLGAEEIARKLGCGKTEVELIIKFQEKSNI
ncbi:hypothetical protein H8S33_04015 [Ornithinibacillus sp. BX22]|uniref:Coupling factor for flagellin transcription and translation n=2 Tax=Ornithinibacillus TaxID=484508 RepID=A0A923RGF1_9BACI|nr:MULTISPECIES: hypothetical protein [Ornithinibacillus]MBC5635989.1 hypothetical protein [Ornithinibacillus hominis]MBS3680022.1 hypothetical protein [Ornithinibacillus massiliensis]